MIKSLSKQEYDLLSSFAIKNRKIICVGDVKEIFDFSDDKIRAKEKAERLFRYVAFG